MSERRAWQLVNQPRVTQRYQARQREDEDRLTQAIIELARSVWTVRLQAHHGAVAASGLALWHFAL
jgi:hypothetical protein